MIDVAERRFTNSLRQRVVNGDDELGWYASLLIEAGEGASAPETIGHVIRLGACGLLAPEAVAKVLVKIPGVDTQRIVGLLDKLTLAGHPRREVWQGVVLCGTAGLARLETAIAEDDDPAGAATLLHSRAPDRAVSAIRRRVVCDGRLVEASDVTPLRHLEAEDVLVLVERFRAQPTRGTAQVLGWTEHAVARAELLDVRWRDHPDPAAREAVVNGLRALCGNRMDPEADPVMIDFMREDPSPAVRLAARTTVEIRAAMFPSVRVRLDELVVDARLLEDSPVPKWSTEVVVERLRTRGAGLRMALAFVEAHPDLLSVDAVRSALDDIANDAVQGALGIETIFSLNALFGDPFVRRCMAALDDDLVGILHPLAISLSRAVPDDEEVFAAIARHSGRFPSPAGQAALVVYRLSAGQRAHQLLHLLETTRTVRPETVRMWASALRDLPVGRPGPDEPALRERLRAVTGHVLGLLPSPTGSTSPER